MWLIERSYSEKEVIHRNDCYLEKTDGCSDK